MSDIIRVFNKLSNDTDRWEYLLAYKKDLKVILDNDSTLVVDSVESEEEEEDELYYGKFDDYIGWSEGVQTLLKVIGVDAEEC